MNSNDFRSRSFRKAVPLVGCVLLVLVFAAGCKTQNADTADKRIPFPKPRSHQSGWSEFHGGLAVQKDSLCLTCHEKSDCASCHSRVLPKDHTNTWRTQSHGFAAAGNRERCLTCHRQDYCMRCHNETAPRSHTGSWESGHCNQCHYEDLGTTGTNCTVCHGQIEHSSAPHPVSSQLTCLDCH